MFAPSIFPFPQKAVPEILYLQALAQLSTDESAAAQYSLEQLAESGPAAIAIILVGLLPVAILARSLNQSRPGEEEQPLP